MSEYWVSKKKYYCKYCEIYIADDAPSRTHHETGLRHQGNKERFVRSLYKASEKKKHDSEEEKRDMARVEQAAQAAFAKDVGSGFAKASGSSSSAPSTSISRKPALKPSSPWANYSTAESLGITDPDEERRQAEAARRQTAGTAGDWQLVTLSQNASPALEVVSSTAADEANRKRAAEGVPADEDRHWKLRKKTLNVGLGELYDPGLIPIKLKVKKEEQDGMTQDNNGSNLASLASGSGEPKATAVPKWSKIQWKRPGEDSEAGAHSDDGQGVSGNTVADQALTLIEDRTGVKIEDTSSAVLDEDAVPSLQPELVKKEEGSPVKTEDFPPAKTEEMHTAIQTAPGGFFRKRKVPASATGSRGRRQS